jgi:hypothetical protein
MVGRALGMVAVTLLSMCVLPEANLMDGPVGAGGAGGAAGAGAHGGSQNVGAAGSAGAGGAVMGPLGSAIRWQSACAYAPAAESGQLDFDTASFTVEFWYKPETLPANGYQNLVWNGGSMLGIGGWEIYLTNAMPASRLAFATADVTTSPEDVSTNVDILADHAYHVVIRRYSMEGDIFLLDKTAGETVHSQAGLDAVHPNLVRNMEAFTLASKMPDVGTCATNLFAEGVMDDVRIFRRKREPKEFDADYDQPADCNTDLAAYWKMDEAQGNLIEDSCARGIDLTIASDGYEWIDSPFDD